MSVFKKEQIETLDTCRLNFYIDDVLVSWILIDGNSWSVTLSARSLAAVPLQQFLEGRSHVTDFIDTCANRLSIPGGTKGEFKIIREKKVLPNVTKISYSLRIGNTEMEDLEYQSDTKEVTLRPATERTVSYYDFRFLHDSASLFISDIANL